MKRVVQLGIGVALAAAAAGCLGQAKPASDRLRQTALTLERQGKNPEAEAAWRAVAKAHPSSQEPYAHLGLLEARQEHYKEAVPLYRKALEMGPDVPGLRLNLGLALFKGGDFKEAIQEFNPLLKNEPASSPQAQRLTILIGMAHYSLTEYAAAVPYLKEAAAHDAQNLPLRLALAHSCLWSKQNQCVLDVSKEILTLDPDSAEAEMLAGEASDGLKDNAGAINHFRAAIKANPKEPNAHFGLGYLLWTHRQYPEAVSEFQAELNNNPDHSQAMIYLGDTQIKLNHPELARPLLENALRLDAGQELAHLDLGILLADAGRQEDALREMRAAAKLDPQDVNVHWRLGRLYRAMGRKDEAKAEFDKASNITKAADSALVDRISNGHNGPPPVQQSAAAPVGK